MRTLYDIAAEFEALADRAFSFAEEGEVPSDLCAELDAIEAEFEDKVAACCRMIKSFDAHAAVVKREADRLADRHKALANASERLQQYVFDMMTAVGKDVCEPDELFTVRIQNNSQPSVEIEDLAAVPVNFDKQQDRVVDKTAIRDQLKKGVPVPGCRLVQGKHLRIR